MDLSIIENLILEEFTNLKEQEAGLQPSDVPFLEKFLKEKIPVSKALGLMKKVIKSNEDLINRGIKGINLTDAQKVWQKFYNPKKPTKNKPPEDSPAFAIWKSLKPKLSFEPVGKYGPLRAYQLILQQVIKLANKADILEEQEMSPALQKIIKNFNSINGALKRQLNALQTKPLASGNKMNLTALNYVLETADSLREILMDVKEQYDQVKQAQPQDSDKDGASDEEEKEAGTDPQDPKDKPEEAGEEEAENPEVVDLAPDALQELKGIYDEFANKFYCDIDPNANRRERKAAQEACKANGIAISANRQHEIITNMINALNKVIEQESEEAAGHTRSKKEEPEQIQEEVEVEDLKRYQQDAKAFIQRVKAAKTILGQVQSQAGSKAGQMSLKKAKTRIQQIMELAGILYGDLSKLSKSLQGGEQEQTPVTEDSAAVEQAYDKVLAEVGEVVSEIGEELPFNQVMEKIKSSVESLESILQYFPKGKKFGTGAASVGKVLTQYEDVIKDSFGMNFTLLLSLPSKMQRGGGATTVQGAAQQVREFATGIGEMFGLDLPNQFNEKVEKDIPAAGEEPGEEGGEEESPEDKLNRAAKEVARKLKPDAQAAIEAATEELGPDATPDEIAKRAEEILSSKVEAGEVSAEAEEAVADAPDEDVDAAVSDAIEDETGTAPDEEEADVITKPQDLRNLYRSGQGSYKALARLVPDLTESEYNSFVKFYALLNSEAFGGINEVVGAIKRAAGKVKDKYDLSSTTRLVNKKLDRAGVPRDAKAVLKIMKRRMPKVFNDISKLFKRIKNRQLSLLMTRLKDSSEGKKFGFEVKDIIKLADYQFAAIDDNEPSGEAPNMDYAPGNPDRLAEEKIYNLLKSLVRKELRGK